MPTTVQVDLFCPAMPVHRVKRGLRRTAEEPMVCTLTWPNDVVQRIANVIIPPTNVNKIALGHWRVDACVGQDAVKQCVVELPEEDVLLDTSSWTMDAQPITAKITVATWPLWIGDMKAAQDPPHGIGTVLFPLCKTNLFTGLAEEIHALGTVVFP